MGRRVDVWNRTDKVLDRSNDARSLGKRLSKLF